MHLLLISITVYFNNFLTKYYNHHSLQIYYAYFSCFQLTRAVISLSALLNKIHLYEVLLELSDSVEKYVNTHIRYILELTVYRSNIKQGLIHLKKNIFSDTDTKNCLRHFLPAKILLVLKGTNISHFAPITPFYYN